MTSEPAVSSGSARPIWTFTAVVLGLPALLFGPAWLLGWDAERVRPLYPVVVFAPVVTAFFLTARQEGDAAVRALARSIVRWRLHPGWYLLSLAVFPALGSAALGLRWLAWGIAPRFPELPSLPVFLGAGALVFVVSGLAEEPGWRGFLQPRLCARFGGIAAGLFVGCVWGLWHMTDLVMHAETFDVHPYYPKFLWIVGASLILGWIQAAAGGSVFLAMVGHFGGNLTFLFVPVSPWRGGDLTALLLAAGLNFLLGIVLWVACDPARRAAP